MGDALLGTPSQQPVDGAKTPLPAPTQHCSVYTHVSGGNPAKERRSTAQQGAETPPGAAVQESTARRCVVSRLPLPRGGGCGKASRRRTAHSTQQ